MWTYSQSTGNLSHDGTHVDTGYSGYSVGKNNPAAQAVIDVGPIPQGAWTIAGVIAHTDAHGPYVLILQPDPATATFGRSGFLIHGDSITAPGEASRGCIILGLGTREQIWGSGDRQLQVTA